MTDAEPPGFAAAAGPEPAGADGEERGRGGDSVGWDTPTPETWLHPASTATSSNGDIRVVERTVTNRT